MLTCNRIYVHAIHVIILHFFLFSFPLSISHFLFTCFLLSIFFPLHHFFPNLIYLSYNLLHCFCIHFIFCIHLIYTYPIMLIYVIILTEKWIRDKIYWVCNILHINVSFKFNHRKILLYISIYRYYNHCNCLKVIYHSGWWVDTQIVLVLEYNLHFSYIQFRLLLRET